MDPKIEAYIRENRAKYTPEAIRGQLIAAGHDPVAIDEALHKADTQALTAPVRVRWRLGTRTFVLLVVLGAAGAAIVWQNQMYSAGGIAAVIYAVIATIALAFGKGISVLVDRGAAGTGAALLAVIGGIGALFLATGNSLVLAAAAVLVAGGLAAGLLILRRANPARASLLGAAVPIVFWLAVTGTCYAPVFGPAVVQPTSKAGVMEIRTDPPMSFAGSGTANCVIYASGFSVNAENLGTLDGRSVSASVATAGDPNVPTSTATGDRAMSLSITLNTPSGAGYVAYASPGDATFKLLSAADGISGTVTFTGLEAQAIEGPDSSVTSPSPLSGMVSWTCK